MHWRGLFTLGDGESHGHGPRGRQRDMDRLDSLRDGGVSGNSSQQHFGLPLPRGLDFKIAPAEPMRESESQCALRMAFLAAQRAA